MFRCLTFSAVLFVVSLQSADGNGVRLRGRFVDSDGRAIAHVSVQPLLAAAGQAVWWENSSQSSRVITDQDGYFQTRVPFAGVRYTLSVVGVMGNWFDTGIVGAEAAPIRIVQERTVAPKQIIGKVLDEAGQPVADAEVYLIGEFNLTDRTRSGADGRFKFRPFYGYNPEPFIYARHGDRVSASVKIKIGQSQADRFETVVRLGRGGTLAGVLMETGTKRPIATARIILETALMSNLVVTMTQKDGRFVIPNVPPGLYRCRAEASNHVDFPPRGRMYERETITIEAGRSFTLSSDYFDMRPAALISGRVIGPGGAPVQGAWVVCPVLKLGDYRDEYGIVETDVQGRYRIATGHEHFDFLEAYDPQLGFGQVRRVSVELGKEKKGVEIRLSGTSRIRGRVTDRQGRSVVDVSCTVSGRIGVRTDESGEFDFGPIPIDLMDGNEKRIRFNPPRLSKPLTWAHDKTNDLWRPQPETNQVTDRMYTPVRRPIDVAHGRDVEVNVVLDETDVLTIQGTITNADGGTHGGGVVYLFCPTGHRFPIEEWASGWAEEQLDRFSMSCSSRDFPQKVPFPTAVARADKHGRYVLEVLRYDGQGKPPVASGDTVFAIGVISRDKTRSRLYGKISVPPAQSGLVQDLSLKDAHFVSSKSK